jgi:hypothetical protein
MNIYKVKSMDIIANKFHKEKYEYVLNMLIMVTMSAKDTITQYTLWQ